MATLADGVLELGVPVVLVVGEVVGVPGDSN